MSVTLGCLDTNNAFNTTMRLWDMNKWKGFKLAEPVTMNHSDYGEYLSYKMVATWNYSEAIDVRLNHQGYIVLDSDPLTFADFYYNRTFVRFNSGILYPDMNASKSWRGSLYYINIDSSVRYKDDRKYYYYWNGSTILLGEGWH